MKFNDVLEMYYGSAEFNSLEANTTQKSYRYQLDKLSKILDGLEFENYMQNGVALPNSVALIFTASVYKAINTEKGDYEKMYLRRVFLVIWRWAENNGLVPIGMIRKLPNFKYQKPDMDAFNKDEILKITSLKLPMWAEPYKKMLVFCFLTGMRPQEAQGLTWADIGDTFIKIRFAKGRSKGKVARLCKTTREIYDSLPANPKDEGLVFRSTRGKPLNTVSRSLATSLICETIGTKKNFYSTRRGCATEMKKSGYDIRTIGRQLGHKNIATTEIYLKLSMEEEASEFKGF